MKRYAMPLVLLAATLVALPGATALSSTNASNAPPVPALELPWAGVAVSPDAEPAMSVDDPLALSFATEGWCDDKVCFTYCGPEGGTYIGGGGVPCICC